MKPKSPKPVNPADLKSQVQSMPAQEEPPKFNAVYPRKLADEESILIAQRRAKWENNGGGAPRVGVALSGGGIRSATFCLGIFQALARHDLLQRIDFLSTVSGGGYFGSFLGALFERESSKAPEGVKRALENSRSAPVEWLRENGRYLSPNGAGDNLVFAAAMLRNWVAVHVVLLTFTLMLLTLACFTRGLFPVLEPYFAEHLFLSIWWSPYVVLPLATFCLLALPAGSIYWLTQIKELIQCFRWLAGIVSPKVNQSSLSAIAGQVRRWLTSVLSISLLITLVLLLFAVVDSLGQTLYVKWESQEFSLVSWWASLAATGMAAFGLVQKLSGLIDKVPGRRAFKVPLNWIAALGALIWSGLIVIGLSVASHALAWKLQSPWDCDVTHQLNQPDGLALLGVVGVAMFGLSAFFSRGFHFINLSSHQQLYAARLKRAYIGASNPERGQRQKNNITNPLPGDEIPFPEYKPHEKGGPLHLINVTVNETVSGKSQIEQRDRKGLLMAVGPCGLSVGVHDHALWHNGRKEIDALLPPDDQAFHALHGDLIPKPPSDANQPKTNHPHSLESLGLGHWVAISGAAFTTGLGAGTTLGLSLLLGLANVRLGYWWDCGIRPNQRSHRTKPTFMARLGECIARILPVQMYLLDEFLGRFHGTARRHWYLSDGGHFENTGCYELIRRRVPFIIASDAGRDLHYHFEDMANLTRKARTDYGAEIEMVRRRSDQDPGQTRSFHQMPALEDILHEEMLKLIGAPEDFAAVPGAADTVAQEDAKQTSKHAMLARVHYLDTHEHSWILFLKPSLTGDEPMDVLQYQNTQPDFPQESTIDQYFDEAQWESYRKLGEHIASLVFATPMRQVSPTKPAWSPSEMCPPSVSP